MHRQRAHVVCGLQPGVDLVRDDVVYWYLIQ